MGDNIFSFYSNLLWTRSDLNRGPPGYEPDALTTELQVHKKII